MSSDVVLGSALRTNLLSLQRTQSGIDKIQNILATGLKVSSALDNPQNFFAAQGLSNRASDLTRQLDGIGQSISTIQAADKGASAVGKLIDQAESLANSAQEEISQNGSSIARATGNIDLRGVTDLTALDDIANNDTIVIGYTDKDGTTLAERTVTIATGDSIEQLLTKINDIGGTASSTVYGQGEVISASLDENGAIQLESKVDGSFRVEFEAAGGAADTFAAGDRALGTALGFGELATEVESGDDPATGGNFEFTAVASTKLTSGIFYESGTGNGIAEASDLLTNVVRDENATTSAVNGRFFGAPTLEVVVDGEQEIADFAVAGLTIQGLVDQINTSEKIQASYDATTGEFSIEAIAADVKSIQINTEATAAAVAVVDFDFGVKGNLDTAGAAVDENSENYVLGAANETLAQIQSDYNEVRSQIDSLVADSGYRGVNLLASDTLTTFFDEDRDSSLNTVGRDLSSTGLGISEANFTSSANISSSLSEILDAKNDVRNFGNAIANSLSIVQTREDFTKDLIAELDAGAEKLTVADQNEEGAKLLALQTRQQLGTTSLSLAIQSQQSVLRLF